MNRKRPIIIMSAVFSAFLTSSLMQNSALAQGEQLELKGYKDNDPSKQEKQAAKAAQPSDAVPVRPLLDNGQYVPPDGVIDGSNLKQFLNSGPVIDPRAMEEASIQADNMMQMPAEAPNGRKPKKRKGFFGAISRGWENTCNAIGFPVGKKDDIGVDASLSSDLPQEVRDAYGAYNPNK